MIKIDQLARWLVDLKKWGQFNLFFLYFFDMKLKHLFRVKIFTTYYVYSSLKWRQRMLHRYREHFGEVKNDNVVYNTATKEEER
jgi:hypothetical protein